MSRTLQLHLALLSVLWLGTAVLNPAPVQAGSVAEDFTTTTYKDAVNATADWNTGAGELRLPPLALSLVGSRDTGGRAEGVLLHGDYLLVAEEA